MFQTGWRAVGGSDIYTGQTAALRTPLSYGSVLQYSALSSLDSVLPTFEYQPTNQPTTQLYTTCRHLLLQIVNRRTKKKKEACTATVTVTVYS